jgi:hypothetical protein
MQVEQGIVRGALNVQIIKTEKLVRHPVEWSTGMRATVDVAIYKVMPAHYKYILNSVSDDHPVPLAARVGQFIQTTEEITGFAIQGLFLYPTHTGRLR